MKKQKHNMNNENDIDSIPYFMTIANARIKCKTKNISIWVVESKLREYGNKKKCQWYPLYSSYYCPTGFYIQSFWPTRKQARLAAKNMSSLNGTYVYRAAKYTNGKVDR